MIGQRPFGLTRLVTLLALAISAENACAVEWSLRDHLTGQGSGDSIRQGPRDLPIVAQVDVVVAGGGIGGVAAALAAADQGCSVVLIEPRNYFGHELTATGHPGGADMQPPATMPLAKAIYDALSSGGAIRDGRLDHPRLRTDLHQRIANHRRIETFLFSLPTGIVMADDQARGVVFCSHNGRQVVLARTVIDATVQGRIAAAAGATFRTGLSDVATASRFGRITGGAAKLGDDQLRMPAAYRLVDDRLWLHGELLQWRVAREDTDRSASPLPADLHLQASLAGHAIADHFASLGIELGLQPAAETWLDTAPQIACRADLDDAAIAALQPDDADAVRPQGLQAIYLAGRSANGSASSEGLAGMLALGELAGRAAATEARDHAADTDAAFESLDVDGVITAGDPSAGRAAADQSLQVRELLDGIEPGDVYPRLRQSASRLPVRDHLDVVVVGGGTSGVIAAIAAARQGVRVGLVEILPNLGGTSSNQVNSYYWGVPWKSVLRLELGERIELEKRRGPGSLEKVRFSGPAKMRALLEMAVDAGVELYLQSFGAAAVVQGQRVGGVVVENGLGRQVLLADVVVDGTGHGDIAVAAGAGWTKGRPTDGMMHEVSQRALRDPTHVRDISDAYLKVPVAALSMSIRESRRVEGDYVVSFDEALREVVFPDTVARWRSNYDTHFPNSASQTDGGQDWTAILGMWRRPIMGSIPYRALLPRGLDGILVVGKAYSTDHDALVGGRMQQDLEHLGEAAGVAAAMAVESSQMPRQLDIDRLQRQLVRRGVLRNEDVPHQQITDGPPLDYLRQQDYWRQQRAQQFPYPWGDASRPEIDSLPAAVERLGGDDALEAMVQLYLAGQQAVPLLRPLLTSQDSRLREEAAILLGLAGDSAAIPELMKFLRERNERTFHYQLPGASSRASVPLSWAAAILLGRFEHGDAVPLMIELLQLPPRPEQYDKLSRRQWADNMDLGRDHCGPLLAHFLIVSLGRIADSRAIEAVQPFLEVRRQVELRQENLNHDLAWGIAASSAWALARMGDDRGVEVVRELVESDQALVRAYARRLLEEVQRELDEHGTSR